MCRIVGDAVFVLCDTEHRNEEVQDCQCTQNGFNW
ncbi:hypothetical protein LU631_12290 [Erwinia tracheiphila]|nr:hypothetical protein [Erwinia tracheiphila]UIA90074.1 hypothetical protein LU631_12290 [Erwinia tracheiphila]UIA98596.1 hypothetical protein LU633_10495 [Erwinia tracheiphila]